jgi:hypothetical protein
MRLCPMDRWVREVQYRQFRRLDWSKVDDAVIECVIERCAPTSAYLVTHAT